MKAIICDNCGAMRTDKDEKQTVEHYVIHVRGAGEALIDGDLCETCSASMLSFFGKAESIEAETAEEAPP